MEQIISLPHDSMPLKIILAICVGLFVGLEREFASKDVGVRTFSLVSLLGLMTQMISTEFAVAGFVSVLFVTGYMNARAMMVSRSLEITTSVAMLTVFCLGVLVGTEHVFVPVAASILMTLLLAWKTELAAFAHGLKLEEIRSVVMLGLLTFVIYPVLPDRFIDPWALFNPKEAWLTVLVLAGISFANYVLLKVYSTKGLYYSALLGGAVNSSAAVAEISEAVQTPSHESLPFALPTLLLTTIAMFIRNLVLLGLFEPAAIPIAIAPLLGMAGIAGLFVWKARARNDDPILPTTPMRVTSPVSVRKLLRFGVMFVLLQAAGTLAERYLGSAGVLSVGFLGGLVSSASSTAATAKLASQGKIMADLAGMATILTSIASAFVNLPLVHQFTKDRALTKRLAFMTFICIATGLILMALSHWVLSNYPALFIARLF